MQKIKNILIPILYFILFFIIQILTCIGALITKLITDKEYVDRLTNCLMNLDMSNSASLTEYLSLCYEVVPLTLFYTSIVVIIPIFILIKIKKINVFKKMTIINTFKYLIYGVGLNCIITFLLSIVETILPQDITNSYNNSTGYLMELPFLIMILTVGIITPIVEEVFFRYLMIHKRNNKILAIILSSLLFGIAHGNIIQGTYAFILGLLFGYVYIKTENLLTTCLLHIGINSSSVLFTQLNENISIMIMLICFILSIFFIIKDRKNIIK